MKSPAREILTKCRRSRRTVQPDSATFAVPFNHPNQMDVDCWPGYGPAGPHTRLPADKYHPRKRRADGPEREGAVASVGRFQGMPNGMLLKSTRGQCTCPGPKCFNYKNEISQNCCADIFDIAGCPRTLGIVGQTMRIAWHLHEPSVCPRGKQKKAGGKTAGRKRMLTESSSSSSFSDSLLSPFPFGPKSSQS
ncbi:uncharacterized protein LOC116801467 [Drosophila sechellia]|uniref:uncharacterized protein LOC116801467 n=1 Tax=Drosophila sechellia TaxID=7238 RepID=UPI0013DDE60E|nr:uncharacterized protein LOC116801467 [Drosophila sechellia]